MNYHEFLETKKIVNPDSGIDISELELNNQLFDFQKYIVKLALKKGRFAIFADCGLGKTPMQLEWAKHIPGNVLILTPLAVAQQTVLEGKKFNVPCKYLREDDNSDGIIITNYEMLKNFDASRFDAIVLDESSILKNFTGKIRKAIQKAFEKTKYKLACTATPAPNDLIELSNHAEFLGIITGKEIIALFFTQDGNTTQKWRLKKHARNAFWKWMATWAMAMRKPSDIGFEDKDFILPPINYKDHIVSHGGKPLEGMLFPLEAITLTERRQAKRESIVERSEKTAELVDKDSDKSWVIWCNLNDESKYLTKLIPDAVELRGSQSIKAKEEILILFKKGDIKVLVTKPSICGFGLNWQHCHNMAFVGLSDSYEQLYQAIRRCYRFGQEKEVNIHIVTSELEGAISRNIQRKEKQAMEMFDNIVENFTPHQSLSTTTRNEMIYETDKTDGDNWTMILGDCMEQIKLIEDESIGLSVFSPPFPGWYVYNNSVRDVGNNSTIKDMIEQFRYLVDEGGLLRILMPGRTCAIHLCQITAMKSREGYMGIKDYRGAIIELMESVGWQYTGEAVIEKNPQIQAIRNKEHQLLFKQLSKDSALMRMGLADYLIYFRKPGDNPYPIHAGKSSKYGTEEDGWITEEEWIEWASPVWFRHRPGMKGGISETDVLNVRAARGDKDERHLCPLQLGVIERCVKLWSNPGDTVFSPFAGIGSEGYKALQLKRKFIGIELKRSYYEQACRYLASAIAEVDSQFEMEM